MRRLFALILFAWLVPATLADAAVKGGQIAPDGQTMAALYLPLSERLWNTGGTDRAGLCVFTSIQHSANYQQEPLLSGFRKWTEARPGGGWPQKVDSYFAEFAPGLKYLQHRGKDLDFLRAAVASGRMPAVSVPGHMVSCIHCDDKWVGILDNNAPYNPKTKADTEIRWYTPAEWSTVYRGWAVVLLHPGPAIERRPEAGELDPQPTWQSPRLVWTCDRRNPSQAFLSRDGIDVGGWDYSSKFWRDWNGSSWSAEKKASPYPAPDWADVVETGRLEQRDYGCYFVPRGPDVFSMNGKTISQREALEAMQCPNCPPTPSPRNPKTPSPKTPAPAPSPAPSPGDGGKLHVIVIGDAAGQVAKDWASAPELAAWQARVLFQNYAAGDPSLAAAGYPSTGFHVLVQLANSGQFPGKIVNNFSSYAGPAALAAALLKADPAGPQPAPATPAPTPAPAPTPPAQSPTVQPSPPAGSGSDDTTDLLPTLALLGSAVLAQLGQALTPTKSGA